MRINRYIARAGITSRRKAEELVKSGKVSVNNKIVKDLTTKISDSDILRINDDKIKLPSFYYYLLNKPKGYTTTKNDPHAKRTIMELLPNEKSLFPVGRLDKETEGLIIVTNDGNFSQNIIHPSKKIEKEYEVITKEKISNKQLEALRGVLYLDDGPVQTISVKKLSDNKLLLVVDMGKNRIVRRMINAINNEVTHLKRIRIGDIKLDVNTGSYRELSKKEVSKYV